MNMTYKDGCRKTVANIKNHYVKLTYKVRAHQDSEATIYCGIIWVVKKSTMLETCHTVKKSNSIYVWCHLYQLKSLNSFYHRKQELSDGNKLSSWLYRITKTKYSTSDITQNIVSQNYWRRNEDTSVVETTDSF